MFSVNMLNEGIHVKGIDAIIMLRGTKSPIVYRQQIGRLLAIGGQKEPIIFDFADNIYCTKYVYELYQDMQKIIAERKAKGRDTSKEEERIKKFQIEDQIKELAELLRELDDNTYNNRWNINFNILKEYINSSEEVREYFKRTGSIKATTKIEIDGKEEQIGNWLVYQKQNLMKKYQGKTLDEIREDENIPGKDKKRMIALLELGVSYTTLSKKWQENFNILKEYINSSEEVREYFERTGGIKHSTKIKVDGEEVNIGSWLNIQRQILMKKYQGKEIDEIREDENIPEEDKKKMIALLELGVSYPTDRKKKEKMKECVGKQVKNNRKTREELERIAKNIENNKSQLDK